MSRPLLEYLVRERVLELPNVLQDCPMLWFRISNFW